MTYLLHLAICLSTYSANVNLCTVVLPSLLLLPVVWLLILDLVGLMVSVVMSFSVFFVWPAFSFGQ